MQPCGVWKINPDQIYVVIFRKLRYNVYKVDIIPAHEAVSAFTAESRCASNCHVWRTWYNVYKVDIIPAHEAVSEAPQKPGAQFRRRLMISAEIMV